MRFPWGFDEEDDRCQKLKMELAQQIMALRQRGVTQFLTACDCGVGLYAAEIVNGLRETTDQDLMLFCYTPHEEQATKWAPYLRERYFTMLEKCTHISVVCPVGTPDAQLQAGSHFACKIKKPQAQVPTAARSKIYFRKSYTIYDPCVCAPLRHITFRHL